ncbi:hypothetical protein JCM3765_007691 [Sporobolomyces pararoseus]
MHTGRRRGPSIRSTRDSDVCSLAVIVEEEELPDNQAAGSTGESRATSSVPSSLVRQESLEFGEHTPRIVLEDNLAEKIRSRQHALHDQMPKGKWHFCQDQNIEGSLERIRQSVKAFLCSKGNLNCHRKWKITYVERVPVAPTLHESSILKHLIPAKPLPKVLELDWTYGVILRMVPLHEENPHTPVARKLLLPSCGKFCIKRRIAHQRDGTLTVETAQTWQEKWSPSKSLRALIHGDHTLYKMRWRIPFRGKVFGANDKEIDALLFPDEESTNNDVEWSIGFVAIAWSDRFA